MPTRSHVTTPTDVRQAATALEGLPCAQAWAPPERLGPRRAWTFCSNIEDQQKYRSLHGVHGAYARMSMLSPAERERGVIVRLGRQPRGDWPTPAPAQRVRGCSSVQHATPKAPQSRRSGPVG